MRPILTAALPLMLLAACSGGGAGNAANDSAGNQAAPAAANAAAPDAAKPAEAAPAAAADPRRAGEIEECIQDVRTEVAPGTDLNAFCGCAVDRMQSGRGERDAMEQCAAEMGVEQR